MNKDAQDDDFWGELPDASDVELPRDILYQQAALLSQKTQGALVGEVRPVDSSQDRDAHGVGTDGIIWALEIRIPRMNHYRYEVFTVSHSIRLYPVKIIVLLDEWEQIICEDTESFKSTLRDILRHDATRKVIRSLRAQAQDPRERLRLKQDAPDDDIPF